MGTMVLDPGITADWFSDEDVVTSSGEGVLDNSREESLRNEDTETSAEVAVGILGVGDTTEDCDSDVVTGSGAVGVGVELGAWVCREEVAVGNPLMTSVEVGTDDSKLVDSSTLVLDPISALREAVVLLCEELWTLKTLEDSRGTVNVLRG